MNSLYTLGVRQSSSIQADLERLRGGDTSASLLGLPDSFHINPNNTNLLCHTQGKYRLRLRA